MKQSFEFDVYFNFNAEDHYLVESLSQHQRNRGLTTFDRSVDQLPDSPEFALSEDEALAASKLMIAILTENSVDDAVFQQMVATARSTHKPVIVVRFDNAFIPSRLTDELIIEGDRSHLDHSLQQVDHTLSKLDV